MPGSIAIAEEELELRARLLRLAGLLGCQPEQLAGAEPPSVAFHYQIVEPILHFRPVGAVKPQRGRLQPGVVGEQGVDRTLLGDGLVGGECLRGFAGVPVGGSQPQAGERGVAGRRVGGDPFQCLLRLRLLVLRGLAGSSGEAGSRQSRRQATRRYS
jgi:hypothetical protein